MKGKLALVVWGPFIVAVLVSLVIDKTAWFIGPYFLVRSLLATLSVVLAIRVLLHTGPRPWPIVGVVAGLAIGHWWVIEMTAMLLFWKFRGFAP